nr:immunoglobulin heavy chain junction region [Macaca mulatta]MOX63051.1 immunoglobulin heavy chain junction region [Macaca mulatta]MOX63401.1 immunoglobulin heavy chain junction region [Macaca mulatta]
CGSPLNWKASW